MKNYELNSILTFGKYKGLSLLQVFELNPSYVDWCILNLDHFNIEEDVFYELQSLNSLFQFSEKSLHKLQSSWQEELDVDDYEEPDYDPYSDWERDSFDALTDGQCGSYDDFNDNGGDWDTMMAGMGH
ncbi:MAG: hypothetical protein RL108_920 [Bacteroidota bacterium]|jgi:hypothetical protein